MYECSEMAYGALDFSGLGYITQESFLNSIIVKERIPFTVDQIKLFFADNNLFAIDSPGINFDSFKKMFFPQLYIVQQAKDDEGDLVAKELRNQIENNT